MKVVDFLDLGFRVSKCRFCNENYREGRRIVESAAVMRTAVTACCGPKQALSRVSRAPDAHGITLNLL